MTNHFHKNEVFTKILPFVTFPARDSASVVIYITLKQGQYSIVSQRVGKKSFREVNIRNNDAPSEMVMVALVGAVVVVVVVRECGVGSMNGNVNRIYKDSTRKHMFPKGPTKRRTKKWPVKPP